MTAPTKAPPRKVPAKAKLPAKKVPPGKATDVPVIPTQPTKRSARKPPGAEIDLGQLNPRAKPVALDEIGSVGLNRSGGQVNEEFLTALRGDQGRRVYREMADNDPVISAGLFAFEQAIKGLDWHFADADVDVEDPDHDRKAAVATKQRIYTQTCLDDMNQPWHATLADICSMMTYGWSNQEIVYKRRIGPEERDPSRRSNYTDGGIGWRKWAPRAQQTLYAWAWDTDGGIAGMQQMDPYGAGYGLGKGMVTIPVEKMLLFRTTTRGGNPEGRALDPATPIPTPDGWRTMGDLQVGDRVFDEQGKVRHVVARADWTDRPRYRLTFADGAQIIADAAHQWPTRKVWERSIRNGPVLRTTAEIAASVKNANGISNHSVTPAAPLQYIAQHLLIDPYVLGTWLGDGDSRQAVITCHADDVHEQMRLFEDRGYTVEEQPRRDDSLGVRFRVKEMQELLGVLGVQCNKHVPPQYLMGSVQQRRDLLAGLLDSDGHMDAYGRVEFVNTNQSLVEAVTELARSLGMDARTSLRRNPGVDSRGTKRSRAWCVRLTPVTDVFLLARKNEWTKASRSRNEHYIVSADAIESGDTVCIEVDSPSHLFLAGRSMVPTHNSMLRGCHRPWHYLKRIQEYEATGIERDLAGLPVAYVPAEYLMPTATPNQKAVADMVRTIVENIKANEQNGVVLPHVTDEHGNRVFTLELLSSAGQKQFDLDKTLGRYAQWIAMALLADFIMLGHENVGSQSLGETKMTLWEMAVDALARGIADVVNNHAVPRLMRLNGFDPTLAPRLVYGDVKTADLSVIATYVSTLATAGALTVDASMEEFLREVAGLPEADNDLDEVHALPDPNAPVVDPKTGLPYPDGATALAPADALAASTEQAQALNEHKAGLDAQARDHGAQITATQTDQQAKIAAEQQKTTAQAAADNAVQDQAQAKRQAKGGK